MLILRAGRVGALARERLVLRDGDSSGDAAESETGAAERTPTGHQLPCAVLTVRDHGPGIEPTDIERCFDPFFTTKDVGEGTGLGLSIVHRIVEDHHGEIDVDSRLGEGAAFQVYLPGDSGDAGDRTAHVPGQSPEEDA